jgi:nicotinate phosphoribosyltransferase
VYKLVEINDQPRIKLSQEVEKLVIPCKKNVYRLLGADGKPLVDILQMAGEQPPVVGVRILCRHPFMENKRAYVTPSAIVPLLNLVWDGPNGGQKVPIKPLKEVGLTFACLCTCLCTLLPSPHYTYLYYVLLQSHLYPTLYLTLQCNLHQCTSNSLQQARDHCKQQIAVMRPDHTRPVNPTPYKISVSQQLYEYIHKLWMAEAPIADLS